MVIGIVGGMGSVATVEYLRRLIQAFPAQKEWDRPRIIIDNRCDMPSRVRGILYNENVQQIVTSLTESIQMMVDHGCDYIVLACNTSHYYLDAIYTTHPEFQNKILHIIDLLAEHLHRDNVQHCNLLASEGTYLSKIYDKSLEKYNITYSKNDEDKLRSFIEAVKTYNITSTVKKEFTGFINKINEQNVVLGCTELPVLYNICKSEITKTVYDPLKETITFFKQHNTSR